MCACACACACCMCMLHEHVVSASSLYRRVTCAARLLLPRRLLPRLPPRLLPRLLPRFLLPDASQERRRLRPTRRRPADVAPPPTAAAPTRPYGRLNSASPASWLWAVHRGCCAAAVSSMGLSRCCGAGWCCWHLRVLWASSPRLVRRLRSPAWVAQRSGGSSCSGRRSGAPAAAGRRCCLGSHSLSFVGC